MNITLHRMGSAPAIGVATARRHNRAAATPSPFEPSPAAPVTIAPDARARPAAPGAGALPARSGRRGMFLIECLAYMACLAIVLGVAGIGFARCWDDSGHLRRNADDIVRALHAGEQWRADLRTATGPLKTLRQGNFDCLSIPVKTGSINYYYFNTESNVYRQDGAAAKSVLVLAGVQSSRMTPEPRRRVTAWRWELELQSTQKKVRMQPLFTFETVAGQPPAE
jgi:hypothetical protein